MSTRIDSMGDLASRMITCRGNGHAWDFDHPTAIEILARSNRGRETCFKQILACLRKCGAERHAEYAVYWEGNDATRRMLRKPRVVYPDGYLWVKGARKDGPTRASWAAYHAIRMYKQLELDLTPPKRSRK